MKKTAQAQLQRAARTALCSKTAYVTVQMLETSHDPLYHATATVDYGEKWGVNARRGNVTLKIKVEGDFEDEAAALLAHVLSQLDMSVMLPPKKKPRTLREFAKQNQEDMSKWPSSWKAEAASRGVRLKPDLRLVKVSKNDTALRGNERSAAEEKEGG